MLFIDDDSDLDTDYDNPLFFCDPIVGTWGIGQHRWSAWLHIVAFTFYYRTYNLMKGTYR